MEIRALSPKYSYPVLSQIQGCAIFLRYWVKLLGCVMMHVGFYFKGSEEKNIPKSCVRGRGEGKI